MNRRSFLKGGGVLAVVGAAIAMVKIESQPAGYIVPCKDSHEPIEAYRTHPSFQMGHMKEQKGKALLALVPCRKCGAMFGLSPTPPTRW